MVTSRTIVKRWNTYGLIGTAAIPELILNLVRVMGLNSGISLGLFRYAMAKLKALSFPTLNV